MTTALISHPDCLRHEMGDHPECPDRIRALDRALAGSGFETLQRLEAPLCDRASLYRVHARTYVDGIFSSAPPEGYRALDPDTTMNPHTLNAARRAAGAGLRAVDAVLSGEVDAAFCNVRPPGHHAEGARAMGFCFFNNIAVAAAHALEVRGLRRVAILDFDVHHGNGTEAIFADNPQVLLCSSFQHPFYPFSGADSAAEGTVNVPLPAGSDGTALRRVWRDHWLPALEAHRPELVLVSAGFDGHRDDPLANLNLEETDYEWLTARIREWADQHCRGRIVALLEGGYALRALGRSGAAHVRALARAEHVAPER